VLFLNEYLLLLAYISVRLSPETFGYTLVSRVTVYERVFERCGHVVSPALLHVYLPFKIIRSRNAYVGSSSV
jgi:hypothetical protein